MPCLQHGSVPICSHHRSYGHTEDTCDLLGGPELSYQVQSRTVTPPESCWPVSKPSCCLIWLPRSWTDRLPQVKHPIQVCSFTHLPLSWQIEGGRAFELAVTCQVGAGILTQATGHSTQVKSLLASAQCTATSQHCCSHTWWPACCLLLLLVGLGQLPATCCDSYVPHVLTWCRQQTLRTIPVPARLFSSIDDLHAPLDTHVT